MPKSIQGLISLYIISIAFTNLLNLPLVARKIQLPEIVFLLLLFFSIVKMDWQKFQNMPLNYLDGGVFCYFLTILMSCLFNWDMTSSLNLAGVLYLIIMYCLLRYWFFYFELKWIRSTLIILSLVAALSAVIGSFLANIGIENTLASAGETYYPYLGYIGRASGFTYSPNMLLSVIQVGLFLKVAELFSFKTLKRKDYLILIILGMGTLLTLSKGIVLVIGGIITIWYLSIEKKTLYLKLIFVSFWLSIILVLNFFTHILVSKKATTDWQELSFQAYTLDYPFWENQEFCLTWTNYAISKKAAWEVGCNNKWLGVGAGHFNEEVEKLKDQKRYPSYFPNYDPHCTYLGSWAETGLIGLAGLLFLFGIIIQTLVKLWKEKRERDKPLIIGLIVCLLIASIEAMVMDIMNFRHYWVLLAILAALLRSKRAIQLYKDE